MNWILAGLTQAEEAARADIGQAEEARLARVVLVVVAVAAEDGAGDALAAVVPRAGAGPGPRLGP